MDFQEVNRFQRGREKGIDLALGLDVVADEGRLGSGAGSQPTAARMSPIHSPTAGPKIMNVTRLSWCATMAHHSPASCIGELTSQTSRRDQVRTARC